MFYSFWKENVELTVSIILLFLHASLVCVTAYLWTTHVWDPRNQTAPSVGLTVTAPTYSTVVNTGCKCANALYAMDLVLQHSAAGAVVAAFADVVLTDVTAAFASGSSTLLR